MPTLQVDRGDTLIIPMTARGPSGAPTDFTGATVKFALYFPTVISEATAGVTVDMSTLGSINVTVDRSLTLVTPKLYDCTLQVIFPGDIAITYYSIYVQVTGVA